MHSEWSTHRAGEPADQQVGCAESSELSMQGAIVEAWSVQHAVPLSRSTHPLESCSLGHGCDVTSASSPTSVGESPGKESTWLTSGSRNALHDVAR